MKLNSVLGSYKKRMDQLSKSMDRLLSLQDLPFEVEVTELPGIGNDLDFLFVTRDLSVAKDYEIKKVNGRGTTISNSQEYLIDLSCVVEDETIYCRQEGWGTSSIRDRFSEVQYVYTPEVVLREVISPVFKKTKYSHGVPIKEIRDFYSSQGIEENLLGKILEDVSKLHKRFPERVVLGQDSPLRQMKLSFK